mmetsp:Transcript_27701/g.66762  ORF Transcript_27701/g.66762 Transcript_27701/m.66762 type:complete len:169 (+) Transcript_27701:1546-2052(+)
MINSLSIGDPLAGTKITTGQQPGIPDDVKTKIYPMDGNVYTTHELHEAYHHYLKVVTTKVDGLTMGKRQLKAYQIIPSSQLAYYRSDMVPEVRYPVIEMGFLSSLHKCIVFLYTNLTQFCPFIQFVNLPFRPSLPTILVPSLCRTEDRPVIGMIMRPNSWRSLEAFSQ